MKKDYRTLVCISGINSNKCRNCTRESECWNVELRRFFEEGIIDKIKMSIRNKRL